MKGLFLWLKKYFIPHLENDFKPHFLRRESMLFIFLLVVIVELGFIVQVFIVFNKTDFLAAVLPGVLTSLTNEERAENNASPLAQNDLLTKAAELKAQDMATRGYFAHTSPDGKTPWYWLDQVGYKYSLAGENLAVNFFESIDVANAWMNSPSHRSNIVKKNYTEIGIGVANGIYEGRNSVFVAQFFGTPVKVLPSVTTTVKKNNVVVKPKTVVVVPEASPVKTPEPVSTRVLGEEVNAPTKVSVDKTITTQVRSFLQRVLSSPREYANYIFIGILVVTIFALLIVLFVRYELSHPHIIMRGAAILAVVSVLLLANIKLLDFDTRLPAESTEASVIAY